MKFAKCLRGMRTPACPWKKHYIYTEGAEKIYTHLKQRKSCVITKLNSHKKKMMNTDHLRLLKSQQLLKMSIMGVGILLSTSKYCAINNCTHSWCSHLRKGPGRLQHMPLQFCWWFWSVHTSPLPLNFNILGSPIQFQYFFTLFMR